MATETAPAAAAGRAADAAHLAADDAARLREAQAVRRAELEALAADRPAHAATLRRLLAAVDADPAAILEDVTPAAGCSARVAAALIEDVDWIAQPAPPAGHRVSSYPRAYAGRRQIDARAARDRARPRTAAAALADVLPRA